MPRQWNHRGAFSMIEVIMVMTLMGILAAMVIPRMGRDYAQEAADSILSDIRYTQHLALTDYRHSSNPKWQRSFWRIGFRNCANSPSSYNGLFLLVGSDRDYGGDIGAAEAAIDPNNGKSMYWNSSDECRNGGDESTSERIFLSEKYHVASVATSGSCSNAQYIGFDHLGRPHQGYAASNSPNYSSYLSTPCIFKFTMEQGKREFNITILPETGHAFISGQLDS